MGRALGIRSLADILKDADIKLAPMNAAELRAAIEEPARMLGVRFDDGLVDELMQSVGASLDALPLLEFTLAELWSQAARQGDPAARAAGGRARGGRAGGAADPARRGGVRRPEPAVRRGDVPCRADGAGLARRSVARGRGHAAGAAAQRVHRGRRGRRAAVGAAGATGEPGPAGAAGDAGCQPGRWRADRGDRARGADPPLGPAAGVAERGSRLPAVAAEDRGRGGGMAEKRGQLGPVGGTQAGRGAAVAGGAAGAGAAARRRLCGCIAAIPSWPRRNGTRRRRANTSRQLQRAATSPSAQRARTAALLAVLAVRCLCDGERPAVAWQASRAARPRGDSREQSC